MQPPLSPFKKKHESPEQRLLNRPISDKTTSLPFSTYNYLFSEIIRYHQDNVTGISELESKLHEIGYSIGNKIYDVLVYCNKYKSDNNILTLLSFLHGTVWQYLFGKKADALEKSSENQNEYMISDNSPMTSQFITPPKDMGSFSSGAMVAGIVEAFCDLSRFPATVTAHNMPTNDHPLRCTILIRLENQ